eukprot:CAMPEP_0197630910 /NCGR_PEP_ID=MMETSP1338-20131121/8252_1 /TAXON_ID=43686 ORGANISM="Pelagodinium beii, Strain RCC1491" /NCGR_SAMPLE_ID=MMETSP1338 /ASSEMBLY_ACC=CAM_ASM_000754 /LENGTH=230 /DNA_ID=CAMNT_0043202249 /DNA_START=20 /DNA_END=709 /DNA_ORIENTATION=-
MSVLLTSIGAAVYSVGRTLVICVCGLLLAKYRLKAGGAATWKDIGRLNAELCSPCLIISVFTKGLDSSLIGQLWAVPLLALILSVLWLFLGGLAARLLLAKDQRHFVSFAATTCAFPNGFAIPFTLMVGLCQVVPWLSEDSRGSDFSAALCILFSFVTMMEIWSIAFWLFGRAAARELAANAEADTEASEDKNQLPSPTGKASAFRAVKEMLNPTMVGMFLALALSLSPW